MSDSRSVAAAALDASLQAHAALKSVLPDIVAAGEALVQAYARGNKVLIFGNGGSAADAQHLAAELVVRYGRERRGLPALALTVNASVLTAAANDLGYERVFERQIEAFGTPGDVAIAISTSGQSKNIVSALRLAKQRQLVTVALTSARGAHLAAEAEHVVMVPSESTPRIQECHSLIGHIWCDLVERSL